MQLLHPYVWILWDLIAVGIFFYSVRKCAKRGFVSTVIGLLIYIVAATAANKAYLILADFLYDNVIHDAVRHILARSFNSMLNNVGDSKDIVRAIPFALRMLLGFNRGEVAALPLSDASLMADSVIDMALKDPLMSVLHGAGFLLLFTVVAYAMRYIAKIFIGINRVPVIGFLNTVMGGILGVIEGILTLLISGFIMRILIDISGGAWWWLNSGVIQSTYIWRVFY